jgi:hypothetical protein
VKFKAMAEGFCLRKTQLLSNAREPTVLRKGKSHGKAGDLPKEDHCDHSYQLGGDQ